MMNAKLLQLLKKLHIYIFIVAVGAVGVYSCTDEEDPIVKPTAPVLSNYFAIQNSTVAQGTIPSNPSGVSLGEVVINSTAIAGGSSHVTITSDNDIQKLYVSIKGSNQYYTITPNQTKSNAFEFIILLSQYLNQNFEIQISALLGDGTITSLYSAPIIYHTAGTGGTGGLQVSLSFNNEKDVDLYVIQPDGTIIFYGNKGGHIYDSISQQYVYYWGLDLDSNPGCNIDSINNENVFYPDSLVQTGTYQVWINMYQNCDTSIATTCVVTANYASQLITPTFGVNPSTHIFPIGEPTNQIGSDTTGAVKIMEFNITNGSSTGSKKIYKPYLTESARMKLDMAHRRR